ncbi:hypothetical protein Q0Z83_012460 [Actinoplanes sichuanensis]|nr:hypothetical protein Q0Z83_012460 [Actinoplanes sichuanensis]
MLPLLVAALSMINPVFLIGGVFQDISRQRDQAAMEAWLDWQMLAAAMTPVLGLIALALTAMTAGMLLIRASRRHFNH